MKISATELIRFASNLSVLIPLMVYLTKIKVAPKQNHIIALLLLVLGLFDLAGFLFGLQHLSTALLFNVGQMAQFAIISWYYFEVVFKKEKVEVLMGGSMAYIVSFVLVNLFFEDIFHYQSIYWAIGSLLITLYGLLNLKIIKETLPVWSPDVRSEMWFSASIVVYFSMTFVLYILGEYILAELDRNEAMTIWCVHNAHNILKNIMFAVGMYYTGRKMSS